MQTGKFNQLLRLVLHGAAIKDGSPGEGLVAMETVGKEGFREEHSCSFN